jgi:hypothetical protein
MTPKIVSGVSHARFIQAQQLVSEFAYRVDILRGRTVEELFTEDGYYEADGRRSSGRDAIRKAYELRSARGPRTSRHLFTNLRLAEVDSKILRATLIMLLFAHDGEGVFAAQPILVSDVDDEYAIGSDRSLEIRSRRLTTVFVDPSLKPILPLGHETNGHEDLGPIEPS